MLSPCLRDDGRATLVFTASRLAYNGRLCDCVEGAGMRVSKLALAFLTAFFTVSASAEMTAAQYKQWAHADNNSVYAAYITGTINAFGWANGDLVAKKRPPLFCPPQTLAIGNRNVYPLLDAFFAEHPGISDDFPIGLAILRSLQRAFPC